MMDVDGDGRISEEELGRFLSALGLPEDRVAEAWKAVQESALGASTTGADVRDKLRTDQVHRLRFILGGLLFAIQQQAPTPFSPL